MSETLTCFRIAREKYAGSLQASGAANRWNRDQEWVLYVSSSRALATLELLVHRSYIRPDFHYKVMVLEISLDPEQDLEIFSADDLPSNWRSLEAYPDLQKMGSQWYQQRSTLLLQVPSVVITKEYNYLVHTRHPRFAQQVKLVDTESFFWDERLL